MLTRKKLIELETRDIGHMWCTEMYIQFDLYREQLIDLTGMFCDIDSMAFNIATRRKADIPLDPTNKVDAVCIKAHNRYLLYKQMNPTSRDFREFAMYEFRLLLEKHNKKLPPLTDWWKDFAKYWKDTYGNELIEDEL